LSAYINDISNMQLIINFIVVPYIGMYIHS
jgi:hypothetical protein